ncbi:MAG: hypothetical protein OXC80_02870 [Gammaproteobacteria bacterium]|nr:hypothetical protein [Gammaproteobacteria bacterium]
MRWTLHYFNFNQIEVADIQGDILAVPMVLIGMVLGIRLIAGEISGRTLEIIYTVPGGCERVWWSKLIAAVLILLPLEVMLAVGAWFIFEPFPILMLLGAMQTAIFYLLVAMGFAALFRSEVGGGIAVFALLMFNGLITGFGENQIVVSPFFNPWMLEDAEFDEVVASTVQNKVGYLFLDFAILALTFMRSNRREKLLSV